WASGPEWFQKETAPCPPSATVALVCCVADADPNQTSLPNDLLKGPKIRPLFINTRSSWQLKNSRGLIVRRQLSQRNAGTVVGFVRPQVNAALFALDSGHVLYVGTDRKRPASIVKSEHIDQKSRRQVPNFDRPIQATADQPQATGTKTQIGNSIPMALVELTHRATVENVVQMQRQIVHRNASEIGGTVQHQLAASTVSTGCSNVNKNGKMP
ncbi:hypothetical protein Tsp_10575, partial [Trichinella spiralis]|uniref:hypothetical protein n=1 Tax=Trichinella spiralis TaxID=6334 RepID=UPI0001EFD792